MLELGDHGSTFAGGPVIAAAANAVLDVLTEPGFLDRGDASAASGSPPACASSASSRAGSA